MTFSASQVERAADILAEAFAARTCIDTLPDDCTPDNVADAARIQDALLARLDREVSGYKAGFTNPPMLEKAGPHGPMAGAMFADRTVVGPGTVKRADFCSPLIEAEVAFRFARDLPARSGGHSDDEILDAVDSALVAIEIADPRYVDFKVQGVPRLMADNGAGSGFVAGPDIPDWRARDLKDLAIELMFDGRTVAEGMTRDWRCDERWVLSWTVDHFARRGLGIRAGDYITTGAAAAPTPLGEAREVIARFAGIGDVKVTFER